MDWRRRARQARGWFGSNRRALVRGALAALLGAGLGIGVNLVLADDGAPPERAMSAPRRAEAPSTTDQSGQDLADAIDVVETGFTTLELVPGHVSYGVIVRNNSELVLKSVPLRLRFVDSAERPVNLADDQPQLIRRLLPGETVGVGGTAALTATGAATLTVEVGRPEEALTVEFAEASGDVAALYELSASTVSGPTLDPPIDRSDMTIRYTLGLTPPDGVVPGHEQDRLVARPHVIYRNSNNQIVGGAVAPTAVEIVAESSGPSQLTVVSYETESLPIDPGKTEIFFTDISAV